MATYIMTWNPSRWHWDDDAFENAVRSTEGGRLASEKWSCGNTRRILAGDRVFLLRRAANGAWSELASHRPTPSGLRTGTKSGRANKHPMWTASGK